MTPPAARGIVLMTSRRCLRLATLPTLAAAAACWLVAVWSPPATGPTAAPGAASPWLALPTCTAVFACTIAGVLFWPTFARGREGSDWIVRLARGGLGGVPQAILGILLAQLLLTLPLACGLARALGAPAVAHLHHAPPPPAAPLLDAARRSLAFALPATDEWCAVHVQPLAGLPTADLVGAALAIHGDGELLGNLPARIVQTGQRVELSFPRRPLREVRVEYIDGSVPLAFPPGALVVVGATDRSTLWNGLLLALVALAPAFAACALAALAGTAAGTPTVVTVLASLVFVGTIGGVGAFDGAVTALLRGEWIASAAVRNASLTCGALGASALLAASLARRRT